MVLRLIWPAMAPNRVKTGPSGAKSDFLSIGRAEIQQGCQRWAEKIWDLGRVGSGPGGFFGFFPEWSQNALGLLFGGLGGSKRFIWGVRFRFGFGFSRAQDRFASERPGNIANQTFPARGAPLSLAIATPTCSNYSKNLEKTKAATTARAPALRMEQEATTPA